MQVRAGPISPADPAPAGGSRLEVRRRSAAVNIQEECLRLKEASRFVNAAEVAAVGATPYGPRENSMGHVEN